MTSRAALWKSHCRKKPYITGAEGTGTIEEAEEEEEEKKTDRVRRTGSMCVQRGVT